MKNRIKALFLAAGLAVSMFGTCARAEAVTEEAVTEASSEAADGEAEEAAGEAAEAESQLAEDAQETGNGPGEPGNVRRLLRVHRGFYRTDTGNPLLHVG